MRGSTVLFYHLELSGPTQGLGHGGRDGRLPGLRCVTTLTGVDCRQGRITVVALEQSCEMHACGAMRGNTFHLYLRPVPLPKPIRVGMTKGTSLWTRSRSPSRRARNRGARRLNRVASRGGRVQG
jgi:hypothetical protein